MEKLLPMCPNLTMRTKTTVVLTIVVVILIALVISCAPPTPAPTPAPVSPAQVASPATPTISAALAVRQKQMERLQGILGPADYSTLESLENQMPDTACISFVYGWVISGKVTNSSNASSACGGTLQSVMGIASRHLSSVPAQLSSSGPTPTATLPLIRSATTRFEVFANRGWQNTGVTIQTGQQLRIEYVSGLWTYWTGSVAPTDARGGNYICARCTEPLPSAPTGSLIGKVGDGGAFFIGNVGTFTVQSGGPLLLRMNDDDGGLSDNSGSIIVEMTLQ